MLIYYNLKLALRAFESSNNERKLNALSERD